MRAPSRGGVAGDKVAHPVEKEGEQAVVVVVVVVVVQFNSIVLPIFRD